MSKKVNGMIADNPKLMAFLMPKIIRGLIPISYQQDLRRKLTGTAENADINLNGLLENFWRGLNARVVKLGV